MPILANYSPYFLVVFGEDDTTQLVSPRTSVEVTDQFCASFDNMDNALTYTKEKGLMAESESIKARKHEDTIEVDQNGSPPAPPRLKNYQTLVKNLTPYTLFIKGDELQVCHPGQVTGMAPTDQVIYAKFNKLVMTLIPSTRLTPQIHCQSFTALYEEEHIVLRAVKYDPADIKPMGTLMMGPVPSPIRFHNGTPFVISIDDPVHIVPPWKSVEFEHSGQPSFSSINGDADRDFILWHNGNHLYLHYIEI